MSVFSLELAEMAGLAKRGAKNRGGGSTKREALTVCDNEGRGGQEVVELLLGGDMNRRSHCDCEIGNLCRRKKLGEE
jgi:hypothetical protein